jgi:hypothetical protein
MNIPRRRPVKSSVAREGPRRLWTCPKCGVKLVTKNLWHSCGEKTLDEWKRSMGPRARELYDGFVRLIAACGRFHVAPARTRIAFMGRVRFAGITSLSERGMTCAFALPEPLQSPRFIKVFEIVPGWWVHRLRITTVDQLDASLQDWLRQSYELMGMQKRRLGAQLGRSTTRARRRRR